MYILVHGSAIGPVPFGYQPVLLWDIINITTNYLINALTLFTNSLNQGKVWRTVRRRCFYKYVRALVTSS